VPGQLSQMRGVFSVLGLDQASQAALRMRDSVEQFLVDRSTRKSARAAGTFEKLGNSLGAMGFLIDMLSYQRALAKKLFIYDDELGELRPLMGRVKSTSKKTTCATSSWKKRAKLCKTAWPPWPCWQLTPSSTWRAHHTAPRLPHAQGQLTHGGLERVWRSRLGHGAVAQHLAG
jgi:hypothetical protein